MFARRCSRQFTKAALIVCALSAAAASQAQDLYVLDSFGTASVLQYDIHTKVNQGTFTSGYGFSTPIGIAFGPNGDLYAGDIDNSEVALFDGKTGAYVRSPVPAGFAYGPDAIAVQSNGNVMETATYAVTGMNSDPSRGHLLVHDGQTGAVLNNYEGAVGSEFGQVKTGPDGNLYVADDTSGIVRFDGQTGAYLGVFASGGGLANAYAFTFGPDGDLYAGSRDTNSILRFDGQTGAFLNVFASGNGLDFPDDVLFGPDGNLYVADSHGILRFNATSGAFVDSFAAGLGDGQLAFAPSNVPEPGSLAWLFSLGSIGMLALRRRAR